jgi:hypothetical protein
MAPIGSFATTEADPVIYSDLKFRSRYAPLFYNKIGRIP